MLSGLDVQHCAFDVLTGSEARPGNWEWVGASPDGLILPQGSTPAGGAAGDGAGGEAGGEASRPLGEGGLGGGAVFDQAPFLLGRGEGILEIKCPYKQCAPVCR